MIDPQGQANKWIKNMEKTEKLKVIKLSEGEEYTKAIVTALTNGIPILIEDVGTTFDPALEPVLGKKIFKTAVKIIFR